MQDAVALARGDHEVAQVLDAVGEADVADEELARVLVDEAAAGVGAEAAHGGLELGKRDLEPAHHHGVGGDAVLTHLAADRDHLRDAGDGEDLRADDEIGDLAQLHGRHRRARDRDQHDLAHDRGDRAHLRLHAGRQAALHARHALGHLLARAVDLGVPVEFDVDDGETDAGGGADAHGAGHAAHRRLDGIGDELLDLLRRQALGLGHQGDGGPVEVGEHVDGQARQREAAVDHEHERGAQHEQPAPETRIDDALEHCPLPPIAPGSRAGRS